MEIPVVIERVAGNGYRITGTTPFPFTVEGTTRDEAVAKLRELVQRREADGTEVTSVAVKDDAPWKAFAGKLRGDPLLDEWNAAMKQYRQEMDQETELP